VRRLISWTLACVALALPVAAEQPRWGESADRLLTIQHHDLRHPERLGLWSFDPDSTTWERLRYFTYNADPDSGSYGMGGSLAATDGVVVFQAWPMNLELEPGSYRIIRRTSPLADPTAVGLAVQGPLMGRSDGARLGLEPGGAVVLHGGQQHRGRHLRPLLGHALGERALLLRAL